MDPAIILLLLRLLSAGLLLGFLGLIAWFIHKDMQLTAQLLSDQERQMGQLRVVASDTDVPAVGSLLPLRAVTSIGRGDSNTIVLDDDYASGEHALVTRRGNIWWLEDLGSRNGMLLNEIPVEQATAITAGDVITIGSTRLKIEL